MAYNPAERLRPAEINAMLANLSHLHAGFRAPAEHHNNGRMLAVSLGLLAAEASRDFFHGFVHRPRACTRLQEKFSNGQRQVCDFIQ